MPLTLSFGTFTLTTDSPGTNSATNNPFLTPPEPVSVKVRTLSSKVNFRQSNRSRAFVSSDEQDVSTDYVKLGNILHQVFSTIRTSADINRALLKLKQEGVLYDDSLTAERITSLLRQRRCSHPHRYCSHWQMHRCYDRFRPDSSRL